MLGSNTAFDTHIHRFLRDYRRLHPVQATQSGVHDYDDRLPDWSVDGQAERRAWREAQVAALKGFDDVGLDASQRLDKRVALAHLAGDVIQDEWGYARRAPAFYVEQALNGLNALLARPYPLISPAPSPTQGGRRADTPLSPSGRGGQGGEGDSNAVTSPFLARLAAIPALLQQGRANLDPALVAPEFLGIGKVAVRGAIGFVQGLTPPSPRIRGERGGDFEAIRQAALVALTAYQTFIETGLTPGGAFWTGPALFERILSEQHGLVLTPDGLYALGEQLTADLQGRLAAKAREIDPSRTWRQIAESLKADHPTIDTLLQAYRDEATRAREFVVTHKLIDLPPGETCEIRPTPPFMRATAPLGYFNGVPQFAEGDNLGILYITPVDPSLPPARQEELLSAHCYTAVRSICFHETYPGHHYQFWWSKLRATPLRKQFYSTLFAEGWALYTEELMEEAGYFDTPTLSLWQLKNSMWRAVRILIDVGLHTGRLSLDAAAQLLVDEAGLEPNTARGEVLRYTTSPTQPSSYMLGRLRVLELRRQYQARQGAAFNLLDFHSRLLDYSSVPPAFIPDGLIDE